MHDLFQSQVLIRIASWRLVKLSIRLRFPKVQQLSTVDLAAWLSDADRSQPLLLDARTLEEYQVSHLSHAQLVTEDLKDLVDTVDREKPIVVYCSVGYRSSAIARRLNSLGYQNVFNLSGSIFQWVNENRPVNSQGKIVTQVHPYNKFWQYLLINSHS